MANISYYFCTKPLQYYNCVNISSSDNRDKILFVIPNFHNAKQFISKVVKFDKRWSRVILLESKRDKLLSNYAISESDFVYSHSDLHDELFFKGNFRNARINVYEEGLGTYTRRITDITNKKWKNFIVRLLTNGGIINSTPGKHKLTEAIYVYDKDKFDSINPDVNVKSLAFKDSFVNNYLLNRGMFDNIFELNKLKLPSEMRVALFLTSNNKEYNYLSEFNRISNNIYDIKLFKPHPSVAGQYEDIENSFKDVMAELLISKLIDSDNQVDVYHYGSAAALYLKDPSIKYIKLDVF